MHTLYMQETPAFIISLLIKGYRKKNLGKQLISKYFITS